ncbi:AcrR family transcriptional regulator [Sphingopyxis panaciterrae]|uniref:TetR/AcrR family transcriptional regulator n=1 Tax=Sphingopyxis panaciterrae TaxID=363841 RepID=UPI0014239768|nr:TetR/AcrR family transcriptional regulator [Sphingopyxis panaciterrae]NIJ36116.1 AcrR family transcriptional regulator [Sphingopyxis panaciterrae]
MDNNLETDVARRTQARILDAANQVIAKVGYARLRMDAVARGSGITRQTIYNYFPNKAQLAVAVLLREGSAVNDRAKQSLPGDLQGVELLSAAILALVDAARATPIFEGMFEEGSVGYVNELAEHQQVIAHMMHDYWAPVIDRLAATGQVRADVPPDRLEWWLSFVYRSLLSRPAEDLDDRAAMDRLVREFIAPSVMVDRGS